MNRRSPATVWRPQAHDFLFALAVMPPDDPISYAKANKMLSVLFGALAKKADDNTAERLGACADLFSPLSESLGYSTGLWKPISKHPEILALAIKKLIATNVFSPAPSELMDAMREVQQRIGALTEYAREWLTLFDTADAMLFAFDRPTWDAVYATSESIMLQSASELAEHSMLDPSDDEEDCAPSAPHSGTA